LKGVNENMDEKKKKFSFPSAYTVLFIVMIIAAILTYAIPAGEYSKLTYDDSADVFVITAPDGTETEMEATQATLDELNVKAELESFKNGNIYKPMAVSGTYVEQEQNGQGVFDFLLSIPNGVYDCVDIIFFIFMIGGTVGIVNYLGVFNSGISELARVSHGKEQIIIAVVCFLIALGGTTFGMCEETIAFYPILIPIFLKTGYDAMTGVGAIWCGSAIGCMFSTVNPFSAVIGSYAAGINFNQGLIFRLIGLIAGVVIALIFIFRYAAKVKADPTKGINYENHEWTLERFGMPEEVKKMTGRDKLILVIFFFTFVVMVYGVAKMDWWFGEMAALFLVSGIVIGIIGGMNEKAIGTEFIKGASDLVGVALVCGLARAANMLLTSGKVSDTLLYTMSGWVEGMNPILFIITMMFIFVILGFFVASTSGLAILSIPIMAPLADAVGLPRELIISAFLYGQGLINLITPTNIILPVLSMTNISYDKYLKWVAPLFCALAALGIVMLILELQFC
jgi:uncharacterized ion transporter superfamily protein YfcC